MGHPTPDRGYAYVILVTSMLGHFIIYGISYSMGVFYTEFREAFGDAQTSIALISSLHTALLFVIGPVSSLLTNRFGPQAVCFLGGLCAGCAFATSVFASNVYMLYVTFGALSGIGLGLSYIPVITIVAGYFIKRRSLAVSCAVTGGGLSNLTVPPISQYLLNVYGWRGTCLLLGGAALHLCVIGMLLRPIALDERHTNQVSGGTELKDKPILVDSVNNVSIKDGVDQLTPLQNTIVSSKEEGSMVSVFTLSVQKQKQFDVSGSIRSLHSVGQSCHQLNHEITENKEKKQQDTSLMNLFIFKNVSYLILCVNNFCIMFGVIMVYVHLPAYAVTAGLTRSQASLLLSFVGIGNIAGRILSGALAHTASFSDICLYVTAFFVGGLNIALTTVWTSFLWLAIISVIFGMCYGTMCALLPLVTIKLLDISLLVSGYGYLLIFEAVGCLISPPIAESLFDHTGEYTSSFCLAGAVMFISSLLMLYPWWKIHRSESADTDI